MAAEGDTNVKPKVLVGVGDTPRPSGESSPFGAFKTLLRDFSNGIRTLQRLSAARDNAQPAGSVGTAQPRPSAAALLPREPVSLQSVQSTRLTERVPFLVQGPSTSTLRETRIFQTGNRIERDATHSVSKSATAAHTSSALSSSQVRNTATSAVHNNRDTRLSASDTKFQSDKASKESRSIDKHSAASTSTSASQQTKLLLERLRSQAPTLSSLGVAQAKLPPALLERARGSAVVSGADKEAFKQFQQPYKADDPSHVPAPARLAEILHADSAVRRGEGRPVPALHALADAVRSGRRRDVADLDPAQVKRIVESALGGTTRAGQILNTPLIKQLVERNVNTVKVLQSAHSAAQARSTALGIRASAPAQTEPFRGSASRGESTSAATAYGKYTAESHEPELVGMAGGNDDVHLHAAAERAKEARDSVTHYKNMDRVIGEGSGSSGGSSSGSATLNLGGASESSGPAIGSIRGHESVSARVGSTASGKASILPFDLQTPKGGQATKAISQMNAQKGSEKRKELTGKLKMVGLNGQPFGEATLEGEM